MHWQRLANRIGRHIIFLRKGSFLTRERFALEASLDLAYLRKVERGTVNVSLRILRRIARCFEVPVYDLVRLAYARNTPEVLLEVTMRNK